MTFSRESLQGMTICFMRAWQEDNPDGIASFFTEDGQMRVNGGDSHAGRDAIARLTGDILPKFRACALHGGDIRIAGSHVLFSWTAEGTVEETGYHIHLKGWDEWTLNDDLEIEEAHRWFDEASLARQLAGEPCDNDLKTCTCGTIEHAVSEPDIPVVFDEEVGEYHLRHSEGGQFILRHCFGCGARLPESRRDSKFTNVTHAEHRRLKALFEPFESLEDIIAEFGEPDFDFADGDTVQTPMSETEPQKIESYRTIGYSGLSETAEVRLPDIPGWRPRLTLHGKYIGDKGSA